MEPGEQGGGRFEAFALSFFSLVNYFALYALNMLLARNLSPEEFSDYNVGVSTLLLLAAVAPLGLEKYALKIIPVHTRRQEWQRLRGFLRFAIVIATLVSVVLSLTFDTVLESILAFRHGEWHIAIPLIVGCLPMLSIFFVLLEVATANGAAVVAASLYRIVLPLLLLGLNIAVWQSPLVLSGLSAGWCFALAWLCVTLGMWSIASVTLPAEVKGVVPTYESLAWLRESTPLLVNGLLLSVITHTGVIILKLSANFHDEASVFAVVMQTGTFVVLLTTSTNRFYLPQISMFLDRRDQQGLIRLRGQRLLIIGTMAVVYIVLVFLFGRPMLGIFGERFKEGYAAACVIAMGASISTTFSLAPVGLQFAGYHRLVLKCTTLTAVVSVTLCVILANLFGTLGAAIAYAVPLSLLYLYLAVVAFRRLTDDEGLG